jgi:hypothetical protein
VNSPTSRRSTETAAARKLPAAPKALKAAALKPPQHLPPQH